MGERVFDATCFIGENNTLTSTSSNRRYLSIAGDTIRVGSSRAPARSGDTGNVGEMCWGSQTTLGITTHYIYVCVAPNTWKRATLNAF